MKRISVLIPHYLSYRWIAACIWHFKQYPLSIDHELIVCDNSMGHPSIKALTETSLGEGVRVVSGDPDLPSHGHGYELCAAVADGDWFFTAENDSFPTRHGWFEQYVKDAGEGCELIGPLMPMASGRYIHPAGACVSRRAVDQAKAWQDRNKDWFHCNEAGLELKVSDWGCHVTAHKDWLQQKEMSDALAQKIENWRKAEAWQEMRSFDTDTLQSYAGRIGITNWSPLPEKSYYLKIGYEAGQWLSYFCSSHGIKVKQSELHIEWMPGRHGRQASWSRVNGGFIHIWAGSSSLLNGLDQSVKTHKAQQAEHWFGFLPENLRTEITLLEEKYKA